LIAFLLLGLLAKKPVIIINVFTEIAKVNETFDRECCMTTQTDNKSLKNSRKENLFLFLKIPNFSQCIEFHLLLKAEVLLFKFKSESAIYKL
jgi:hypothetical protein